MNPKEYEKNVLITESCDFESIRGRVTDQMIRLLHAGLGLSSELSELTDAYADPTNGEVDWVNIMEEAADLLWYIAVAVNTLGFDHNGVSEFESWAEHIDVDTSLEKHSRTHLSGAIAAATCQVGDYNDLLKKHLFYGRELNLDKMKKTLQKLCMSVSGICIVSGYTIEKARETNIAKLKARYGEKFTEAAALNRDLETERKILEGQ